MPESLFTYRQALARALDDEGTYSVGSADAGSVTIQMLVNLDPAASTHQYDGRWVYLAVGSGAGQQRKVRTGGYTPATGRLLVDPPWTSVPTNGNIVQITGLFPSAPQVPHEDNDYRTLINRGLTRLIQPRELTLRIHTARQYPLDPWPWLDREERLLAIREPSADGLDVVDSAWRGWKLRLQQSRAMLTTRVPFTTDDGALLVVEAARPMDTLINRGGVWVEANGLLLDTDLALPTSEDVVAVARVEAYAALMVRSAGVPSGPWETLYTEAKEAAMRVKYYDYTSERPPGPRTAPASAAQAQPQRGAA